MNRRSITALVTTLCLFASSTAFAGVDDAHAKKADKAIASAITFLRKSQGDDGSWTKRGGPGVTALVLTALLDEPSIKRNDPMIQKGLKYVLSCVQEDGSIHSGMLETYSTAICLAMLGRLSDDPQIKPIIARSRAYLKGTQWHEGMTDPQGNKVDKDHPYYGGTGYGSRDGRPDGSNAHFVVEAFIQTGSDCKDPEIVAAATFFSRLQGSDSNKMFGDKIQNDGGAVYSIGGKDGPHQVNSSAGSIDEGGRSVLRTYGSMSYAMFKTYCYAELDPKDPRVVDAKKWISHNYTLDFNPGMPEKQKLSGYYYYLLVFARAMEASKESVITTADGKKHHWANELVDKLCKEQQADGSWSNPSDRFMEGDPNVVTSFVLNCLVAAKK